MKRRAFLALLTIASPTALVAQDASMPSRPTADLEAVAVIGKLILFEGKTVESIRSILETKDFFENDKTGFGGRIFALGNDYGSTSIRVRGFTFDGNLTWVRVTVQSYPSVWSSLVPRLMATWATSGGRVYSCGDDHCFHEWTDDTVLSNYKSLVASQLGPVNAAVVPDATQRHYQYLISPFHSMLIGSGPCGLQRPNQPVVLLRGKQAIDTLVAAQRLDLIVNVLRGYNAGGRVYALLALHDLRRRGDPLSPEVADTMQKVQNLDVPLSTCSGCIVGRVLRANQILPASQEQ